MSYSDRLSWCPQKSLCFSSFIGKVIMKKTVLLATLLAAFALTACGKKEEMPVAPVEPAAPVVISVEPVVVTVEPPAAPSAVDAAKEAGAAADSAATSADAAKMEADKAAEAAKAAAAAPKQ
jgi:predicted small lipoprotein YifL